MAPRLVSATFVLICAKSMPRLREAGTPWTVLTQMGAGGTALCIAMGMVGHRERGVRNLRQWTYQRWEIGGDSYLQQMEVLMERMHRGRKGQ
jgi:hypothetical protein